MSEQDRLTQALELVKAGNRAEARRITADTLWADRNNASAWILMAQIIDDPTEALRCWQEVARLKPDDPHAQEEIAKLKGEPALQPTVRLPMAQSILSRRTHQLLSSIALILANILPIYGVLALGWRVADVLILYWAESIPIAIFALLRIRLAARDDGSKTSLLLFFPIHFGGFMLIHFAFLYVILGRPSFALQEVFVILFPLFVSHGISYFMNYVANGEFQVATPTSEYRRPYSRIAVMHLTLILGVVISGKFPDIRSFLVVLVVVKTVIDLYSHLKNHSRYDIGATV